MPRFRKKPVEIEAVQWNGQQLSDEPDWLGRALQARKVMVRPGDKLVIETLEGDHTASKGDWIIQGVKGEIYPCKPDIFAATYDPVE